MKPLVVHIEARIELNEAVGYYDSRVAGLGLDFALEVESCLASIQKSPSRFSFHKGTKMQRAVIKKFPYVVFFRELKDRVFIAAVAHAKRQPDYWSRRKY